MIFEKFLNAFGIGARLVTGSGIKKSRRTHSFIAGESDNLTESWLGSNQTADFSIKSQIMKIRGRSRDLAINDPYYARFIEIAAENILGPAGVQLQMRVTDGFDQDGAPIINYESNAVIESAFKKWSKRLYSSSDQRESWSRLQRLVLTSVIRDGEIFLQKIRNTSNPFGFSIKPIEADHVPIGLDRDLANGGKIRMGIEYKKNGQIKAFHVTKEHPGDSVFGVNGFFKVKRIPAHNIIHIFVRDRPSQSRGIPWGVTSMSRKYLLDSYEHAEVVAANVSSRKMGFYHAAPGDDYDPSDGHEDLYKGKELYDASPGAFEILPEGWDVKSFDPQHPTTAFKDFSKSVLRGIASGLGVGYNNMANDYEGVNFSSLRASNLVERDHWRMLQNWLIESLHEEVFYDWLRMSLINKAIELPLDNFEKYNQAVWRPRGWAWVDPVKEITAYKMAIELGLDSATNIIASQGRDIENVLQDIKNEAIMKKRYGIELSEKEQEKPSDG